MPDFTMLDPSPPFEAYLVHMNDCVPCCDASGEKEVSLRCEEGQQLMSAHDKLQKDRYQADVQVHWDQEREKWQQAFRILRNIKGRQATDIERLIFNVAKFKGLTFSEAVIVFEAGMMAAVDRLPNESLTYNPKTGEMMSVIVTSSSPDGFA